jgi:hypothetical protein
MKKDLDKRLQDIEDLLEQNAKQTADIYSLRAQKSFDDYSGSLKEFLKERKLRRVATGRKSFFRNIAGALTGNAEFADLVSKAFDAKYSSDEIENAKKQLEEEFGVKPKVQEPVEKGATKEELEEIFKQYFDPITSSVKEIIRAVEQTGSEARSTNREVKMLTESMVGMIERVSTAVIGGKPKFSESNFNLKPETIVDKDGQEYLYYPGAPEGRQIYEKGKKGTAGRIASKKVQKKLKDAIKNLTAEVKPIKKKNLMMAVDETTGQVFEDIKRLLSDTSATRKTEMEQMFQELYEKIGSKETSVQKMESDEMEALLKKTLKTALKEFFNENPELLNNNNGLSGILPFGSFRGLGRFGRFVGKGLIGGAVGTALMAGGTVVVEKAIQSSNERTGKIMLQTLTTSPAGEIARLIGPDVPADLRAYRVQEFRNQAKSDSTLLSKLNEAERAAGTLGISPLDIKKGNTRPLSKPNTDIKPAVAAQTIIEGNRRQAEMAATNETVADRNNERPVNQVINQVMQTKSDGLEIHNKENTFNRLVAQDFDHPYTYSTNNMG